MAKSTDEKPILVHIYKFNEVSEKKFSPNGDYLKYATDQFADEQVYKVKVWDTRKGAVERNNPHAKALLVELV